MATPVRQQSEADIYHVTLRGVSRQLLFEDDADRRYFLGILKKQCEKHACTVLAWCLMGNHVHLLLRVAFGSLSMLMRELETSYAIYFNNKYDRVGHLYQDRFASVPITTDEQLITAIRYIHFNPVKAGLSETCDYQWSSYRECMGGTGMSDTAFVLKVFGGRQPFVEAHCSSKDLETYAASSVRRRLSDSEAQQAAGELLGQEGLRKLGSMPRGLRNEGIAQLRRAGLSCKQIERFTGVSRGIVERVKWR